MKLRQKIVKKKKTYCVFVCVAVSASESEQDVQQAKTICTRPAQIKPSCSYSSVTEPHQQQSQKQPGVTYLPHLQSVFVQLINTQRLVKQLLCKVNQVPPASLRPHPPLLHPVSSGQRPPLSHWGRPPSLPSLNLPPVLVQTHTLVFS